MKLQVAMDVLTVEAALDLAGKVAEYVDIIELGTPLVKNAGLSAVTAVKTAHPDKIVFADLKTMDAGELEADIAFSAGADLVSVLGGADDSTIAGAVKAAKAHNKGIVVDLIGVADKVTRAREARALGAKFIEFHAGLDEQAKPGYNLDVLLRAGEEARVPFSVAGGVNISTIEAVQRAGADVAVVGGSIYSADDPALAAKELRAAII
ncbi:3-hexulose-6-phosphate synthase [Pseudarthrobacter raffinosi]|uniref:3-hexulose-6-phosphate synthase n=1 Tax=Pseudarthrobacter raffinosi TaxID=2953651 RepID=UPI00208E665E|nr:MULTISPECIES: 3-hexulose-6-phosphate synthase [unclassified Pseudarthrobacter]MCO4239374.1 3-hexulose-6-phosphate synthase [Pseudarthrobacter sp. MDT3-28]MCO4251319.1 3-hexulose-6-phosphate synthase [Pseudarthrobacter sp. MDT3-9]MCO4264917.1 3-hexulose-6-phosphate synthase [Pseudarthrobacter sp. MDT3-26]